MPLTPLALTEAVVAFLGAWIRRSPRLMIGGALLASTAGVTYALRHRGGGDPVVEAPGTEEDDLAPTLSWCAEGLEPLPGGGCYAAPTTGGERLPLILYLHGIFEKGPGEEEERDRQKRVAARATARGFAVVALRGAEGACTTNPERSSMVCWPSNERTADKAPTFVKGWDPSLRAAQKRHASDARYVLGFSNGGFFAGLVAERDLFDAKAFVVAHAGPVEPVKASGGKPPLLLISADDDLSQEGMVKLDDELTREGWLHEHYVREGGHALPDSDIDAALTFFERLRTESLPLRPPLSARPPRARVARRNSPTGEEAGAPVAARPTVDDAAVASADDAAPTAPAALDVDTTPSSPDPSLP